MKKIIFKTLSVVLFSIVLFSCTSRTPKDLLKESIIPKPVSVVATNSSFVLSETTAIYYQSSSEELKDIGNYLAEIFNPSTGYNIQVQSTDQSPGKGNIYLELSEQADMNDEGYTINITEDLLTISGKPEGIFRGVQTLRQLLPAKIEDKSIQEGPWEIATGTITDKPSYGYRGAMLDVARHFFTVDEVKRYIDLLAIYKLNTLHLHLSDDQGWRIEIKSWPNLTTYGGSTEVGGESGGFYTQDQYKELVSYAQGRFITIIPEIDMPGHTNAALASYAELNCDGKARELYTETEVGFSTLCTDKEITYQFIDDVVRELAEITPGPYIHIGGDESHVTPLEDYIPFVNRVQEIVVKHGKKVLGWDEIALSTLVQDAVVQYWAKAENAQKGVEQGAKVLISPAIKTYLDMQYDSTTKWGLHWAAYIEVDDAYNWDPAELAPGVVKENILGVESPMWSETLTNIKEVEYMAFPRILCNAEVAWTEKPDRNWDEFKIRLGKQCARFDALNINYFPSTKVPWH